MLRLLYGKSKVFDEVRAAAQKGVRKQIIIVPQHYSHEAERRLCAVCGDSVSQYCEVLTMKRLANRVFGETGGLAEAYLDDGGRLLVMCLAARSVSSGLKAFEGQIKKPEFLQNLVSLIDEFKTYGVSSEKLADTAAGNKGRLSDKITDLSLLYSAYDAILGSAGNPESGTIHNRGQNMKDPGDLLSLLLDKLEEGDYAAGKTVYIEGFTEFTPQEMKIVDVLLCKALSVTACFDVDPNAALEGSFVDLQDDAFYGSLKTIERLKKTASSHRLGIFENYYITAQNDEIIYERSGASGDGASGSDARSGEEIQAAGESGLSFLRRNLFRAEPEKYRGKCKDITLHTAQSIWSECEQAASEILRLCREDGCRFKDIVVAAPDYSAYAGAVEAVFDEWNIPLFSDRTEDIMQKPVMSAVDAAIDSLLGGFEYRDMFRYLKTGLPGLTYEQCCKLENYVLAWNIKGRQWISGRDWTMNPKGFSADTDENAEHDLTVLNEIRAFVIRPFIKLLQRAPLSKELPASELAAAFYEFLLEVGIDGMIGEKRSDYIRRGELKLAEEYAQLWGFICDALDTCAEILKDTPMDFKEFAGMLRLLLGSMKVGTIPVSVDSVAAGDAGRMRHRNAKCVILLGACSGAFPPPSAKNSLLTDENRTELIDLGISLEPPSSKLMYRELDVAYSILTLPGEKLYISWPLFDRGSQRSPSYLIERIREMFSLRVELPEGEERLTFAIKPCLELALRSAAGGGCGSLSAAALSFFREKSGYSEVMRASVLASRAERGNLSEDSVRKLYGDRIKLTASRADKLRSCRYSYFMQYGLRAKPRLKAGLDALESGTFLHFVLEGTAREAMKRGGFKRISAGEIRAIADGISEKYASEVLMGMTDKSARVRYLFQRLKRTAARVAENVAEELQSSEFEPLGFELEFGENGEVQAVTAGEGPEEVELMGVVDRVDGWEKDGKLYIRVVDYKSGYKKFDLTDIWHGLGLQMLIYLFALEERGIKIYGRETVGAGVLYIPVKDAVYSGSRGMPDDKIREKTDEALRRSGLVLRAPDIVEAMEAGKPKRFIPVSYARGSMDYSAASSLAGLEQLGKLKQHVDMLLRQMGRALHEGRADADPYYRDLRTNACSHCDFAPACRFDESNGVDRMRFLYKVSPKDFWERLGVGEGAD